MSDADPFGKFTTVSKNNDEERLTLYLGSREPMPPPSSVTIDAAGWYAALNKSLPAAVCAEHAINPFGSLVAACLGVAELFKMACCLPQEQLSPPLVFDCFRLQTVTGDTISLAYPTKVDFGRLLLVGAGSVGSALAYVIKIIAPHGELAVVDDDKVKIENFNRSPIFGVGNLGLSKAQAIETFLKDVLSVKSYDKDWNSFLEICPDRKTMPFDVWIAVANEKNVRAAMQNAFPPLMIHASTGRNWLVNFGRHIPFRDDCLLDRFPSSANEAQMKCSMVQVALPEGTVDAALPFLSFLAGVLIAADLVRLNLPGYPQTPNHCFFGFSDKFVANGWDRSAYENCICRKQSFDIWSNLNRMTKFAALTLNTGSTK